MSITSLAKKSLKRMLLGPMDYPQQFPVGLREPQSEIAVWLHGNGSPRDVTNRHFMACGAPLTVAIVTHADEAVPANRNTTPVLRFCTREQEPSLLGEITLRLCSAINIGNQKLLLFQIDDYKNFCLPWVRLWARYLMYARQRSKAPVTGVPITAHEVRAMCVFYICPRPVVLVSVVNGNSGNIFPMNLMGPLDHGYFAFALNAATPVSHLVEKVRSVALSSIPFEQTGLTFRFGKHHKQESIDWTTLPFATSPSHNFAFPVPTFARRVREMTIEEAHPLGSHKLFVARTVSDTTQSVGPECFVIHGIYQAWRSRQAEVVGKTGLSADCCTPTTLPKSTEDENATSPRSRYTTSDGSEEIKC